MAFTQLQAEAWYLILALAVLGLAALVVLVTAVRLRRGNRPPGSQRNSIAAQTGCNAASIEAEIARLCAGGVPNEGLIKQLSPEDRALFEVSAIDALNKAPREEQQRLRSALVRCGYDEQCARRVMGEEVSDRVRASALLRLLRPQSRDSGTEVEALATEERPAARAAVRTEGPLEAR